MIRWICTIVITSAKYDTKIGNPCAPARNVSGRNRNVFIDRHLYRAGLRIHQQKRAFPTGRAPDPSIRESSAVYTHPHHRNPGKNPHSASKISTAIRLICPGESTAAVRGSSIRA